ncbi:MAG: hypothetical protein H6868_03535 [Rhodospirillales bacterium]|nr:hypothetical protein [Rhodospirillales bacterium]
MTDKDEKKLEETVIVLAFTAAARGELESALKDKTSDLQVLDVKAWGSADLQKMVEGHTLVVLDGLNRAGVSRVSQFDLVDRFCALGNLDGKIAALCVTDDRGLQRYVSGVKDMIEDHITAVDCTESGTNIAEEIVRKATLMRQLQERLQNMPK